LGEKVEAAPRSGTIYLVLVFPGFDCPTGAVYQAFDRLGVAAGGGPRPDVARVRALTAATPLPPDGPFNDLTEPACRVRPELAALLRKLGAMLHRPVHVTGSGSTVFTLYPDAVAAEAATQKVKAETGLAAVATHTLET
jgi:4-diphosphocytidyl-2-C-methyl-D-erythritol kinase